MKWTKHETQPKSELSIEEEKHFCATKGCSFNAKSAKFCTKMFFQTTEKQTPNSKSNDNNNTTILIPKAVKDDTTQI